MFSKSFIHSTNIFSFKAAAHIKSHLLHTIAGEMHAQCVCCVMLCDHISSVLCGNL